MRKARHRSLTVPRASLASVMTCAVWLLSPPVVLAQETAASESARDVMAVDEGMTGEVAVDGVATDETATGESATDDAATDENATDGRVTGETASDEGPAGGGMIPRAALVDMSRVQSRLICSSEPFLACMQLEESDCVALAEAAIEQCLMPLPVEIDPATLANSTLEACPRELYEEAGYTEERARQCLEGALR